MKVKVRKGDSGYNMAEELMDMPTVFALYHAGTVACRLPEANTCHVHIVVLGETSPEVFTASGASMFCFVFFLFCACATCMCVFLLACVLGQHTVGSLIWHVV